MENIDNIIEIKRGLYRVCDESLMEAIASLDDCEKFYRDVFGLYGLEYNTETLEQKRSFIAVVAKYFILFRLPSRVKVLVGNKYHSNSPRVKNYLNRIIENFYEIYNSCEPQDFIDKYAEFYGIGDRNFAHELKCTSEENRDASLSNFAKAVKKVYKSKDIKK